MATTTFYPPKLMFADDDGKYYLEYIPPQYNIFQSKLEEFICNRRIKHSAPLYYWHYNRLISPLERKVIDVNFIMHVLKEHPDGIEDKEERRYFNKIIDNYHKEIIYFLEEKNTKWRKHKHAKNIHLQKDPYYLAYKKHWVNTFIYGPNMKLFYHGVGLVEALDLLDIIIKNIEYVFNNVAKSLGLSREEYENLLQNPTLDSIKVSQVPPKKSMGILEMLNVIYWVLNIFISITSVIMFNLYDADTYSYWGRISTSLIIFFGIQLILLTPYLFVFGIYKLLNKLFAKIIKPSTEDD